MISAFSRGGLLEEAKHLARDFEATYDRYDLVMLNTMLCAYCRAGEMGRVMEMLKKMDGLAISPDYNTFHILIKYFCKEKLYLLAYQTMKDMHSKGHQPEEV
jgi:pentatricopeptide repeat protein